MKKSLLTFLLINSILVLSSNAQNYRLWASYLGGGGNDFINCITTDASGNVYVTGWTYSTNNISTPGSFQPTNGGDVDAFLAKFNGAGVLQWSTYYGGTDGDYGYGVKTDLSGNVYITGYTYSTSGIATPGSFQSTYGGVTDAFLVKFDSNGNRIWGTYVGGSDFDQGFNVGIDASGSVYLTGTTTSTNNISTVGSSQVSSGGYNDAFLMKFAANGSRIWGTFFGGEDQENAGDVAVDGSGNIIICGTTSSTTGIGNGGFQNTFSGNQDAYVAKYNSLGVLQWSSYYGGPVTENGFGIATGPSGAIFLAGMTNSPTGIASGGFQNSFGGYSDAFLVKFNSSGSRAWATYYGDAQIEEGNDIATDAFGNCFLALDSYSPNVLNSIATPNGFQSTLIGQENHALVAFNSNGARISATYYGGLHEEEARVTVNVFGDVYLAGTAKSTTGISYYGNQNTFGGGIYDGFLVKFATAAIHEEVIVPNDSVPPGPTSTGPIIYAGVGIYNGVGISLTNAVLKNFSPGAPLPASGSSMINFTCDFTADYSNGGPPVNVTCTALVKMKVDFIAATGQARMFDTELLQLDLEHGTFPAGLVLRESPFIQSKGELIITNDGSQLRMASFFDVFTELSTDYGQNWQAASSFSRIDLQNSIQASIPTLGEWGLICLGLLLLTAGIVYLPKTN